MNSSASASSAAARMRALAGGGIAERDVFCQGAAEESRVVRHPGEVDPPSFRVALREVHPSGGNAPRRRLRQKEE